MKSGHWRVAAIPRVLAQSGTAAATAGAERLSLAATDPAGVPQANA
jgi:hypothetical protein